MVVAALRFLRLKVSRGRGAVGLEYRSRSSDQLRRESGLEHLESRRASRIASYYQDDVRVEERDRWPEVRTWAVERLGALREALQSHVNALG